jgi:hypothetical protein
LSSIFFGLIAFSGVSQQWEFKNTTKNVLQKSRRKVFTKKSTKHPNPIPPRFSLSRFWAFLGKGSSKIPFKKMPKTNLTLVLFWPLTHPPTTGVTDLLLPAP